MAIIASPGCSKSKGGAPDLIAYGGQAVAIHERTDVRREVLSLPFRENIWTIPIRIDGGIKRITFSGEYLLVETKTNELVAVNRFNGLTVWRYAIGPGRGLDFPPAVALPGVAEELNYHRSILDRRPIELDLERKPKSPEDEEELKKREKRIKDLEDEINGAKSRLRQLPDDDVIFLVANDYLSCIERESMKRLWSRRLSFIPSAPPFASRTAIFIPSYELDRVYALDTQNMGAEITYYKAAADDTLDCDVVNRPIFTSPALIFVSQSGYIYSYNTNSRSLSWAYKTGGPIKADPVIYEHYYPWLEKVHPDGSVTRTTVPCDVKLHYSAPPLQVSVAERMQIAKEKTAERSMFLWLAKQQEQGNNVLLNLRNFLFVGSSDLSFYALDANEGRVEWKYEVGGLIKSPAYARDDTVYVKTENGALFALDVRPMHRNARGEIIGEKRIGALRWRLPLGEKFLLKNHKSVYVLGPDREIYAMDEYSGAVKGRYKTALLTFLLSNTLDDIFYAATDDGYLYALREPTEKTPQ
ncbi:MAG: hypothetical protein A2Z34_07770 [Planctomycetes bacterium RBG_16_59_8]|nr:MAG: hypothetical protein A2Z34_07770 [Planctomycetes bacterium RBG_16_59_8]